jgi:hypothetical protein
MKRDLAKVIAPHVDGHAYRRFIGQERRINTNKAKTAAPGLTLDIEG